MAAAAKTYERRCLCCNHADRARIEVACARGVGLEAIARQFSLKKDSVHRHWKLHVTAATKATLIDGPARLAELAERADAESMSSLEYFGIIRSRLMDSFLACADSKDVHGMGVIAGRMLETLREIGKLTGEIQRISGVTINNDNRTLILASPIVAEIEQGLVSVLAPYPEARATVIAMLRRIDARNAAAPAMPNDRIIDAVPLIEARADA